MHMPELDEPITRGQVVVDRGDEDKSKKPANALHAFSRGATFGVIVAGQIVYVLAYIFLSTRSEIVQGPMF